MSKRLTAPYRSGPSRDWIKVNFVESRPPHTRPPPRRHLRDIRSPVSIVSIPGHDSGGKMLAAISKVDRYRKEANRCAELAKDASPAFLAEIYQKVAMRYVFMAEDLLKGPNREGDAIERADLMISRLRSDATIEGIV